MVSLCFEHQNNSTEYQSFSHQDIENYHQGSSVLDADVFYCSGSECCSDSTTSNSISPQSYRKFPNAHDGCSKKLAGFEYTETIMTEVNTSSTDECNQSDEFITSTQVSSGFCLSLQKIMGNHHHHHDDNDRHPDEIILQQPTEEAALSSSPLLSINNQQQQWALISKHDNFQLKIEAEENYVCFIGADTVQCHLLLSRCQEEEEKEAETEKNHKNTIDGRQAVLIYANGSFHLKDLNSSCGTYINERRVPSRCFVKLNANDEIRFGFSSDVYQLKRINHHHHNYNHHNNCHISYQQQATTTSGYNHHQQQQKELVVVQDEEDRHYHHNQQQHSLINTIEPSPQSSMTTTTTITTPMNKLFRIKSGSRNKKSTKEKVVKDGVGIGNSVGKNSTSSNKLSPSSFSLISSSSSNSSSSSSSTSNISPSSVFMSAMKMMKMRFKKKSSKDKGLICSGNDDITFIRYDNPGDRRDTHHHNDHSVSAPESPNQPRNRIYHSHTYQNEYPHPRKLSAYQIGLTFDEEHEYDEVTHENDINTSCSDVEQQSSISTINKSGRMMKKNANCFDVLDDDDNNHQQQQQQRTLCRRKICNSTSTTSTAANTILQDREIYMRNHEVYDDDGDDEHECFDEDDNHHCGDDDENQSVVKDDLELNENSTLSKTMILPHLNSEDRLNNNSSLDAVVHLLNKSINSQKKCEMNSSCKLDNSQHSSIVDIIKDENEHYRHIDELPPTPPPQPSSTPQHRTLKNVNMMPQRETIIEDNSVTTFGSRITSSSVRSTSINNSNNNNVGNVACGKGNLIQVGGSNSQQPQQHSRCSDCDNLDGFTDVSCQEESFFEKSSSTSLFNHNHTTYSTEPSTNTTATPLKREKIHETTTTTTANKNKVNSTTLDSDSGAITDDTNELYDIDDIGHLRRPSTNTTNVDAIMSISSSGRSSIGTNNVCCESLLDCCSSTTLANDNLTQSQLSLENDHDHHCRNRSRHSIGGMAFVINFDDDQKVYDNRRSPLLLHNQKHQTTCEQKKIAKLQDVDEQQQQSLMRLNSKRTVRSMNKKTNIDYVVDNVSDNDRHQTMLHQQEQNTSLNSSISLKKSDTFDKKINIVTSDKFPKRNSIEGNRIQQLQICEDNNHYSSAIKMANVLKNKNSLDTSTTTNSNSASKTSADTTSSLHSSTTTTTTRNTQLSESAVYLINRMFEDSDYHHHHHRFYNHDDENQYYGNVGTDPRSYYPVEPSSQSQQSVLSSGSESLYDIRYQANQATDSPDIPHVSVVKPTKNQHHQNHHHVVTCNSSSNASTRMKYDDSLSPFHSNLIDSSTQRLSMHQQSVVTVVPSNSSLQSKLDKQIDLTIDDDSGDLIPDDISDTGTYVVEIDEKGHKHHLKPNNVMMANKNNELKIKTLNSQTKPNQVQLSDEDLAGGVETNSDDFDEEDFVNYEIDCENQQEGEDKLEAARKQIDELFSNYEKNQTQKQENIFPTTNFTNNATFTRSKRRSSSDKEPKSFNQNNISRVVVDDKCLPISIESSKSSTEVVGAFTDNNKSKKRISSELMSAFKRINSKLEKTARLGKLSLTENHQQQQNKNKNNSPNINAPNRSRSPISTLRNSRLPFKCQSAPGTPLLDNRKNNTNTINRASLSRKASIASSNEFSSPEKLDDQQSVLSADNHRRTIRARNESITSSASMQSSNLRFNRAFALRRARLGIDTCGVEISEQAACKAKESQIKSTSQKKNQMSISFTRNDGGRFSLRVSNPKVTSGQRAPRNIQSSSLSSRDNNNKKISTVNRKSSKPPLTPPFSASKIPTIKSYSTSSSVCSSIENLSTPKKMTNESKVIRIQSEKLPMSQRTSHSDNEIVLDGDCSSCDESPSLFNRFGRSSLRCSSLTNSSSTPWLKSFKSNTKNVPTVAGKYSLMQQSTQGYPLFGSSVRNKESTEHRTCSKSHSESETQDMLSDTPSVDSLRPMTSFQMGKRFFSTKPHRIAQFDKEFSNIVGGRSASANGQQITSDPNLMTHSVTESLLSNRSTISNNVASQENKSNEHPPGPATSSVISSSINARIFSISPLDSLVISAINQLSSKLRTRMRDFLERERSNHFFGSEARSLIDEILPQIGTTSGSSDSRFNQTKSAYNHESSNISRDLSNILKNLKKVEQIFDVFSMLMEPNIHCQEVQSVGELNETSATNSPIITNASDSDTSGGEGSGSNIQTVVSKPTTAIITTKPFPATMNNRTRHQFMAPEPHSPPKSSSTSQPRSGFFIEI